MENTYTINMVYANDLLYEIKRIMKEKYYIYLEDNLEIDNKMRDIICNMNYFNIEYNDNSIIMDSLIKYYVALYNDTVDILEGMQKIDKLCDPTRMKIILILLNKEFLSGIDHEYYINVIKEYSDKLDDLFHNCTVAYSNKSLKKEFREIIKTNPEVLKRLDYFDGIKTIIVFGSEVLTSITDDDFYSDIKKEYFGKRIYGWTEEKTYRLRSIILSLNHFPKTGFYNILDAFDYYTNEEIIEIDKNYDSICKICYEKGYRLEDHELIKYLINSKCGYETNDINQQEKKKVLEKIKDKVISNKKQ